MKLFPDINKIFNLSNEENFNSLALEVFSFQYKNNLVYQKYCQQLNVNIQDVNHYKNIPFLPISFFKTHPIQCGNFEPEIIFTSSGTTGNNTSKHFIKDVEIYQKSFLKSFDLFYGDIKNYIVLGLLPSYLERKGSSLIFMFDELIKKSGDKRSGFYLSNYKELIEIIDSNKNEKQILLIGVSFALLTLAEEYKPNLSSCIVMETGGMKGKREELTKSELHYILKNNFQVNQIHSEYGMTELLSQAYSFKDGFFNSPPWMKILTREYNDPFSIVKNKTGCINVIDLANVYSCSFIATDDIGRVSENQFEILGRMDNSDLRGCNLLIT